MKTAFCPWCNEETPYVVDLSNKHLIHKNGIGFFVRELNATCKKCGFDVDVPEVNDQNAERREKAYRKSMIRRKRFKDLSYYKKKYNGSDFTAIRK